MGRGTEGQVRIWRKKAGGRKKEGGGTLQLISDNNFLKTTMPS